MDIEGMDSETSQEYPDSEDGDRGAQSVFHAARSDVDTLNSTRSLYDTDVEYTYLKDRCYCSDYFLPVDDRETFRWQMYHQIWYTLLDDSHTTVHLEKPRRILDIGCGTGDWAEDMGVAYPDAEVIGTDIAPLQPTSVPRNVFFEIDDAECEGGWNWTEPFDFVHIRSMKGAFKDWKKVYQESYTHLEPGGWIEVIDFDDYKALLDYFKEEKVVIDWFTAMVQASAKSPFKFDASHLEPALLEAQGFVDVTTETYDIPMGAWGSSREEKNSAMVFLELQANAVEALCLRMLHEWGGWDLERIDQMCQEVVQIMKRMAKNPRTAEGCFFRVKVLKGRKPVDNSYTTAQSAGKETGFLSVNDSDFNDSESVTTVTKDNLNEK